MDRQIGKAELLYKWIMYTAAITGMGIVSALWPVAGNLPLIVLPSILVLLFAKPVFFEKLKLTTLVIMRVLIVLVVWGLFDGQRYVNIILWMLVINILEATFNDLIKLKKVYNAISGFAVAIGVFALSGSWIHDAPVGEYYLTGGATLTITALYVAAYTIWNWVFVTDEFSPSIALLHVGVLSAPLFGCLITGCLGAFGGLPMWLLLRANTLSIGGWLQIGNKEAFEKEFHLDAMERFIKVVHTKPVQIVLMIINVGLIACAMYLAYTHNAIALPAIFF